MIFEFCSLHILWNLTQISKIQTYTDYQFVAIGFFKSNLIWTALLKFLELIQNNAFLSMKKENTQAKFVNKKTTSYCTSVYFCY